MKKGWTNYSISVWVTGLILLVEGVISLSNYWLPGVPAGIIYIVFAGALFFVASKWKGDKTPLD